MVMPLPASEQDAGNGEHPVQLDDLPRIDDADAAAKAITAAGRALAAELFDVMQYGRMAIGLDTNRAPFGIWQAYDMRGAGILNQPGAFTWNENMSRDFEGALGFYTTVFDYGVDDMSGGGYTYAGLTVDGRTVAGVGELPADADDPPSWTTYFATSDTDATVGAATRLGGSVVSDAVDTPFGRMACLRGPEGEVFSVIEADDRTAE